MTVIVNCVAYDQSGRSKESITVEAISDVLKEPDKFVWVGIYEPDDALLDKLKVEFDLHELAVEDARHAHQRPKIESYGESLFIILHTAQFVDGTVRFGETAIFLGPRYLLTVRHGSSLSYAPVRARCELHPKVLRYGPAYGLYAVMDFIVDNFAPLIDSFNDELKRLERELFKQSFDRHMIEQLYALNRDLLTLRLAVAPIQDICHQLMRFHEELIPTDIRVYFRDVYDHAVRINEAADRMRELLSVAMQVNLAMVSVGQNEVVKRLAGWAGILAVPTMLASFWGMNFKHMPELEWTFGYPLALGVIAFSCVMVYRRLKKARWL